MKERSARWVLVLVGLLLAGGASSAPGEPVPGGTLDPTTIPKYVIPLVIPPVMDDAGEADDYQIAVRQFKQQILPGGIWNTLNGRDDDFGATTVWSYGPAGDEAPDSSGLGGGAGVAPAPNSQLNYPAYTIEATTNVPVDVRWINDLVGEDGNFLPHLLPVDQTVHWANPPGGDGGKDKAGTDPTPYLGPVPIVTHVHGAHVGPESDGYPEAWWLPAANGIPETYARSGTLFDDVRKLGINPGNLGYADFSYPNDQPATTLWYHDHTLGTTRLNVYAGPAGFWLIRGGIYDAVRDGKKGESAKLPGPAPVAGQTVLELNVPGDPVRSSIREIPIVIQDRSFNADGSLFYPDNRAFFEELNVEGTAGTPDAQFPGEPELRIPFVPESDILPIWNPEAFFNTMVVNGVAWPTLQVAPARYRFRLLNGCNSRFLNLALVYSKKGDPKAKTKELPFIQIGAEQGFLPRAAEILTGFATPLPGDGTKPKPFERIPASDPQQALLMGLAERADAIVDFEDLPDGTRVRMINTAPDAPFGGFPDDPADPETTGQVMEFVVNSALLLPGDEDTTNPYRLQPVAEGSLGDASVTRQVSLNEGESEELCVEEDEEGNLVQVDCPGGEPFAPKEALLGLVDFTGDEPEGVPLKWTAVGAGVSRGVDVASGTVFVWVTENPALDSVEEWDIYNFTEDAHPIHLHLVRFEVVHREPIDGDGDDGDDGDDNDELRRGPEPWETGFKDTVIAYPEEVTRIKARFDVEGLYVWHCHIVEHEDNEMMRPYFVGGAPE
jgi:FtsP/CotA-like multicopper oxidase with cupredoxin domain